MPWRSTRRSSTQNPKLPGIHYRLGRILLSKSPPDEAGATKEFEEELKIDPENASAEFMLGEIARQAGQWDEAITHFSKASRLDESFLEAYLASGNVAQFGWEDSPTRSRRCRAT